MKIYPPEQYQPAAAQIFSAVKTELALLLPGARIEHVGSSAIPGAHSKGDLDVCISVEPCKFEQTLATLVAAGYTVKPDTLRTNQLCMLESTRPDISLALQLIEQGSEFEFFVIFRDALRRDANLVSQYNALKLETASLGEQGYREAKSEFIREVLQGANAIQARDDHAR
jgi:GrpB-like predicted nucleotidyltransferase (UPF0157 family)